MPPATRVPPFDPAARRGVVYRTAVRFGRTPVGYRYGVKLAARVDPTLLRLSGGRMHLTLVLPTAHLTTVGAKSGEARTVAVLYFTDGDDAILIASSFGRERHPAWYHNLKANPEATLLRAGSGGRYQAAEVADPAEHDRLYGLAEQMYAGYADYKARTAAIGRHIPIMRLTPLQ